MRSRPTSCRSSACSSTSATGGNAYRAELYFVGTREYPHNRFGGRIDDVRDPLTGLIVTLRVFGEYSLKVTDPNKIILNLTGTVNVEDNTRITSWLSEQLLKVMRTEVTRQIVRNGWPILGLSAYTPELEAAVLEAANAAIFDYGMGIVRMGNFDVNLAEEDEERLKQLAKDVSYTQLAGGFQQYAAGEAMLGAGQGMAQGGGAVQGAFLAAGLGFGQQMAAPPPQQQQAPQVAAPPAPAAVGAGGGCALHRVRGGERARRQVLLGLRHQARADHGALHRVRHRDHRQVLLRLRRRPPRRGARRSGSPAATVRRSRPVRPAAPTSAGLIDRDGTNHD